MIQESKRRQDKTIAAARDGLDRKALRAMFISFGSLLALFIGSIFLARIHVNGNAGVPSFRISVILIVVVFEFLDASAGMGYGTAVTPLLLLMGYTPLQIVPAVMIQQTVAGYTGVFLHGELGNVTWSLSDRRDTSLRLGLAIAGIGSIAVILSITSIYGFLKVQDKWIKLYVLVLLLMMAVLSFIRNRRTRRPRPRRMLFFGFLAGFNKGLGGGGYGPVLSVGGLLSGLSPKKTIAIISLSEAIVCSVSLVVWYFIGRAGNPVDFRLLPSMMLGSLVSALTAPYIVKILPEKVFRWVIPGYCLLLAVYGLIKLF